MQQSYPSEFILGWLAKLGPQLTHTQDDPLGQRDIHASAIGEISAKQPQYTFFKCFSLYWYNNLLAHPLWFECIRCQGAPWPSGTTCQPTWGLFILVILQRFRRPIQGQRDTTHPQPRHADFEALMLQSPQFSLIGMTSQQLNRGRVTGWTSVSAHTLV